MEPLVFLYSARSNGWLTVAGNYSSDAKEAKKFSLSEAQRLCRRHIDRGTHRMFPVRLEDLEGI